MARLGVSSMHCAGIVHDWYIQVNLVRIFVLFVRGINYRKEYCLSPS